MNKIIKTPLQILLNKVWQFGTIKNDPINIMITGSPRGGTTWLLELLETFPNTRRVWEPFLEFPLDNINHRPYLKKNSKNKLLKTYLDDIFEGRKLKNPGIANIPYSKYKYLKDIITANKTLIKFTRAQRLLPWLSYNYNFKKILIMRHPLATIASQLYHPSFTRENTEHPILADYDFQIDRLEQYIKNIDVFEKRLAITWCFDYLIPLKEWDECDNTILITYEKMVKNPQYELNRIEKFLNIEFPQKVFDKINTPSQTTVSDSNVKKKDSNPLVTWKKRLSANEINNILEVLEKFAIDFYSDKLEPDYKILESKYGINL